MTGSFVVASVPYGAHAEQLNLAKATTFGYVVNADDNTVSVIDTASNKVVATIPVGGFPDGVTTTPDGTYAYLTNGADNTVSVIDTNSNKVVATIPVVGLPHTGTYDRRHQPLVYLTIGADNTVFCAYPHGESPEGTSDFRSETNRDDREHAFCCISRRQYSTVGFCCHIRPLHIRWRRPA
jgi:YVTN family beta-propeller protein